jgi:hypothetical protein
MLILDKQKAIERIVALSGMRVRAGDGGPPPGARPRVAAYRPRRSAEAGDAAGVGVTNRSARPQRGAPHPA